MHKSPGDRLRDKGHWDIEEVERLSPEQLDELSSWAPPVPLVPEPLAKPRVLRPYPIALGFLLAMVVGVAGVALVVDQEILAPVQEVLGLRVLTLEEELRAIEGVSEAQIKGILKGAELREKYGIDWVTTVYTEYPEEAAAQCAEWGQPPACGRIVRTSTSVHMADGTVLVNPSPYNGDMTNNSELFSMQDEIELARIRQFNNYVEWQAGREQEATVFERPGP
jgi:hypothetical protein